MLLSALSLFLAMVQSHTLQSDFTMTLSMAQSQPVTYSGSLLMQGERFRLEMLSMEAAYDGKTLYLYQAETDELTLSVPETNELNEVNPFRMVQQVLPLCNTSERKQKDGKETLITFTPKDGEKVPFRSASLCLRTDDLMPLSLEMREQKQTSLLRFTNPVRLEKDVPLSRFSLSHPEAYLNDLR